MSSCMPACWVMGVHRGLSPATLMSVFWLSPLMILALAWSLEAPSAALLTVLLTLAQETYSARRRATEQLARAL